MSSEIHPERPENLAQPAAPDEGPLPASEKFAPAVDEHEQSESQPPATRTQLSPTQVWGLRDLLLFLIFVPVLWLLANLLALSGYAVLKPMMGWHLKPQELARNTFFLLVLQSILYILLLGCIYLLATIYHLQPFWRSLGWRKPSERQALMYLAGGILMAMLVTLAPPVLPDSGSFPLQRFFTSPTASYAVGVFAILIAPVVEETVFRGLLFAIFERSAGLRSAILITAVLFAGLHIPEYWQAWNHVLMILLVGLVLSAARGMTGSLAPSILLHIGYNGCMMAGFYFSTQHFRNIQGLLRL
jgi:membrane protease YdiL (CAAX protease family)